jgi:hypothetical protein
MMAAFGNQPSAFCGSLPPAVNVYPLLKLALGVVGSKLDVRVACSLQALIVMLLGEERSQVCLWPPPLPLPPT